MKKDIHEIRRFPFLMKLFRRKCTIQIHLVEIMFPVSIGVVTQIVFLRQPDLPLGMSDRRVHDTFNGASLFGKEAYDIVGKPAAMPNGLFP